MFQCSIDLPVQTKEVLLPEPLTELSIAKGLVTEIPTQIEGLFKRYPLIWEKRKKGTLIDFAYLMDDDFKKSFLKTYLYYFLLEAKKDPSLRSEINQLIKKIRPTLYNQIMKQDKLISSDFLDNWMLKFANINIPYPKTFTNIAYLEWLGRGREMSFQWSEAYQKFYTEYLDIILDNRDLTFDGLLYNRIKKQTSLIEQTLKQFEEYQKTKFNHYCKKIWNEAMVNDDDSINEYYGLSIYGWTFLQNTPTDLNLNSEEIFNIFLHTFSYYFHHLTNEQQTSILKTKQIKLEKEDFQKLSKIVPFAMTQFLISKQMKANRIQFFDSIETHDIHLAQKLKIENKQLKQTVSTAQKEQKKLIQEKEELKKMINTQIKKATEKEHSLNRELERTLKRTQSEKERLESELERMKKELQQLKEENQTLKETIPFLSLEDDNQDESTIKLDFINQPSTLFIGGFPTVVNRLKERMPHCKYFECGMKVKDEFFNGVERAYIMTRYVDHGMVYQAEKNLPNALIKGISTTNLSRIFEQLG